MDDPRTRLALTPQYFDGLLRMLEAEDQETCNGNRCYVLSIEQMADVREAMLRARDGVLADTTQAAATTLTREEMLSNALLSLAAQMKVLCTILRPDVPPAIRMSSSRLADAAAALAEETLTAAGCDQQQEHPAAGLPPAWHRVIGHRGSVTKLSCGHLIMINPIPPEGAAFECPACRRGPHSAAAGNC